MLSISPRTLSRGTMLACLLIHGFSAPAYSQGATGKLKFGINENYAPPFIFTNPSGQVTGGILFDLMTAIANETNLIPEPVPLPRNRVEQFLDEGTVDLICRTKKDWMRHPDNFFWSEALFDTEEIVIARAGTNPVTSLTQLNHHAVGTVIGFEYPQLVGAIARGEMARDDAPSENNLLKKMVAGRNLYAIVDAQTYYYFLRKNKVTRLFANNPYVFETHTTACAISRKSPIPAQLLLDAVHKIKSSGKVESILKKEY